MTTTLEDAARLAAALPGATEVQRYGNRAWSVGGKVFAWERPFSKADLKRFGDQTPPTGPNVAIHTGDLGEKEALLAAHPDELFTITHFDGYPAVLIDLSRTGLRALTGLLREGWEAAGGG